MISIKTPTGQVEAVSVFVSDGTNRRPAQSYAFKGSPSTLQTFQNESATISKNGVAVTLTEDLPGSSELRFLDNSATITAQNPATRDAVSGVPGTSTWIEQPYIRANFFTGNSVGVLVGGTSNQTEQWWGDGIGLRQRTYPGSPSNYGAIFFFDSDFRIGAVQETVSASGGTITWYAVEKLITVNAIPPQTEILDAPFPIITGVPSNFFQDTNVTYTISLNNNSRLHTLTVNGVTSTLGTNQNDSPITVGGFTFNLTAFIQSPNNASGADRYTSVTFVYDFNIDSTISVGTPIQVGLVQSGTLITNTKLTNANPDISIAGDGTLILDNGVVQNLNSTTAAALSGGTSIAYEVATPITAICIRNTYPNLSTSGTYLYNLINGTVLHTEDSIVNQIADGSTIVFDTAESLHSQTTREDTF